MSMWKQKASLPLHCLLVMNAIGYTLAPPIASVFLSHDNSSAPNNVTLDLDWSNGSALNTHLDFDWLSRTALNSQPDFNWSVILQPESWIANSWISAQKDKHSSSFIWIPYTIMGGAALIVGIVFVTFVCLKLDYPFSQTQSNQSFKDMFRSWIGEPNQQCFIIYFIITIFFYFCINRFRVNSLMLFLFTIAVKAPSIGISKTLSAWMLTSFRVCTLVGRLLAGILSQCIPLPVIFLSILFMQLGLHTTMLFFALDNLVTLWALSCAIGLFLGPSYPTALSWSNHYVKLKGIHMAMMDLGLGIGSFSSTWIAGFLFQYHGPQFIFLTLAICGAFLCTIIVPLQVLLYRRGNRFREETDTQDLLPDQQEHDAE